MSTQRGEYCIVGHGKDWNACDIWAFALIRYHERHGKHGRARERQSVPLFNVYICPCFPRKKYIGFSHSLDRFIKFPWTMHFSCVMRHYRPAVIVIYNDSQTIIMDLLLNNAFAMAMTMAATLVSIFHSWIITYGLLHDSIVDFTSFQFCYISLARWFD